jgi:thiol-disulfide isomerase/thioredoxin
MGLSVVLCASRLYFGGVKTFAFFSSLLLLTGISQAQFRYLPVAPQVGQVVSFTYSPQGTPLAADSLIEARFIRYGAPAVMSLSQPLGQKLVRQGSSYVGQLTIPRNNVSGMMLLFRNAQQTRRVDLNRGLLYTIPVCDDTGCPLPHALGGQASAFTRSHFLYESDARPDPNRVVQLYELELGEHPDLRPLYWSDYLAALVKQKKPGYGPKVDAGIRQYLASRPKPTLAELTTAAQLYESMGDFGKANAVREQQKTADPAGSLAQKDRAMAVRNQPDWNQKKALYQAFAKEFPTSSLLPALSVMMTDGYYKNNDIRGMLALVNALPPTQTDVLMLNTIAFQMADEKRDVPTAEALIKRALADLDVQPRPGTIPASQWASEKQNRHRQLQNTYARALEQQGRYADAWTAYQTVVRPDDMEDSDARLNERYFLCALQTGHTADAQLLTQDAIQLGLATNRLKTVYRDWYAKQPGQSLAKADAHLHDLEADQRENLRDELKAIMINEPAPAFSMTDLQGRTISSSACRGKVVVLDFWATWCGPCIASFPAMQQAQTRFESDPNVRFLFVNTREGGPLQRVHSFMERNTYPFVVPIDAQQRVANAYKVQGIPTKVIIDGKGRVRYRSIGYNGNPETTVKELAMVVEMLKEEL